MTIWRTPAPVGRPLFTFLLLLVFIGFMVVSNSLISISKTLTSLSATLTSLSEPLHSLSKYAASATKSPIDVDKTTQRMQDQTSTHKYSTSTHKYSTSTHKYSTSEISKYENNFGPMDDPGLVRFIQQRYLVYPSKKPSILTGPEVHTSQEGQSQFVDELLKGYKNGFFVEAGAHDGKYLSNSFFFENYRGWTGLLVEPTTKPFRELLNNRPASYAINGCLGTTDKTSKVEFLYKEGELELAKISQGPQSQSASVSVMTIQSLPLYSILRAIGVDTIDYFSLDIEGPELEVLKTIPWDKLKINVITLEYRATPGTPNGPDVSKQRMDMFMNYFKSLGLYDFVQNISQLDLVFARKDLNKDAKAANESTSNVTAKRL